MVRLCTHCKKADTGDEKFKYCTRCLVKLRNWLDRPEPASIIPTEEQLRVGQDILDQEVKELQYGKKLC